MFIRYVAWIVLAVFLVEFLFTETAKFFGFERQTFFVNGLLILGVLLLVLGVTYLIEHLIRKMNPQKISLR